MYAWQSGQTSRTRLAALLLADGLACALLMVLAEVGRDRKRQTPVGVVNLGKMDMAISKQQFAQSTQFDRQQEDPRRSLTVERRNSCNRKSGRIGFLHQPLTRADESL